jgi:MFS family permease
MTVVLGSIAMAHVAQKGGWRTAVSGLQYVGYLLLGLCLWKFLRIPTKPLGKKISSHKTPLFRLLWDVVSNRRIFLYGLLSIGAYSSVAALSDLWGVGFLTIKFHLTKLQATSSNTMIFVGFGIGSLFFPWICGHGKRILRGIRYGSLGMAVLFAFIMYGPIVSTACVQGILFSLGFLSSVEVLCFILANQRSRPETSGLINGWVNTFNMMGAAFIQQVMGRHIDLQWKGLLSPEGIKIYQVSEYVGALLIPLGVIVGCTVVAVGMRAEHHSLQPSSFHDE